REPDVGLIVPIDWQPDDNQIDADVFWGDDGWQSQDQQLPAYQDFAVISGTYREVGDELDETSTDEVPFKLPEVGNKVFECEIEMSRDIVQTSTGLGTFHVSPSFITVQSVLDLLIYPYGFNYGDQYEIPLFVLSMWESGFNVQGSQQQPFRFRGKSQGPYRLMGQKISTNSP